MARKTKPRTKPKTKLHSWAVNIDGALTHIEAQHIEFTESGAVIFGVGDAVTKAINASHWTTVELQETDQD